MTAVLPDVMPPRWTENMRLGRACLYRFRSEAPLSEKEARAAADELVALHGRGRCECSVVRLDANGHDWEFRFKQQIAPGSPARVTAFRT